jgi:hypothetical protein
MGAYDDIGLPVQGQPISSGTFGIKVRNAIIDLDRRVSAYDSSTGTGKAYSTTSLVLATTTETAGLTITGMVFKAGLAYEATMRMGLSSASAGTLCQCRVRKYNATPSSGADWGEFFRFEGKGGSVMSCIASIFLINNTAADVTSDVNFVVQSSVAAANAITCFGSTTSPRYFTIRPTGFAVDYAGMGVQVS